MKIAIDTSKCIGAGLCVVASPELFAQRDEDGIVYLINEHPDPRQDDSAREAARQCPTLAITILD
ncbi:ferredoxin [Pigmentiphaga sp.]|uniref:ferredoxin n=1 Tax=Pigmentiphaga sp. TaxID=1977564 RepID=UPI0025F95644|nr:ferredoxin [Pigmentiphaga sp.]